MESKRPTLNDPQEYALIKSIYFDTSNPLNSDYDSIEVLEREESRVKNIKNNAR